MRIVLYTHDNPGFINRYYMNRMLCEEPHEFIVVSVRQNRSFWDFINKRLKRFIYELRFGKPNIRKDNDLLHKTFSKETLRVTSEFRNYRVNAVNDTESEALILKFKPEVIIQLGAGVLKENIFGIAQLGTINIHHGYAPEVRGQQSTLWALYYGITDRIGVTCHYIDAGLDTGAVIDQYHYAYQAGDSYLKIQETLIREGYECLRRSLDRIGTKVIPTLKEAEVLSCYFGYFTPESYDKLLANNFNKVEDLDAYSRKKYRSKVTALFG